MTIANPLESLSLSLGQQLVSEVAPEEADFYHELVARDPQQRRDSDHTLGFGGSDAGMVILSGFLLEMSKLILGFLWENGKNSAGELVRNCSASVQEHLAKRFKLWLESGDRGLAAPIALPPEAGTKLISTIARNASEQALSADQQNALLASVKTAFVR